MTTPKPSSQFQSIISFPQGAFLISQRSAYFLPKSEEAAFHIYASPKELYGKVVVEADSRSGQRYALAWEMEDGALISARLIAGQQKFKGTLLDATATQDIFARIDAGLIPLHTRQTPPWISIAMQTQDGRQAVILETQKVGSELWFGPKGALEKIEAASWVSSMGMQPEHHIRAANGDTFHLHAASTGWGEKKIPMYNDEVLMEIPLRDRNDIEAFGFAPHKAVVMLDPFAPEIAQPTGAFNQTAPKSPKM